VSAWAPVQIGMPMIGRVQPFGPNGEPSAIDKHPVAQPLLLLDKADPLYISGACC